jgi:hypothetical protein
MQAHTAPKLQTTKLQRDADAAETLAQSQQADMMTTSAGTGIRHIPTASNIVK